MQSAHDDAAPEAPRFLAHTVHTYQKSDGTPGRRWSRIGVAFPHKDKPGFNIQLDAVPTNGLIVLLPPDDARAEDRDAPDPAPARQAPRTVNGRPQRR